MTLLNVSAAEGYVAAKNSELNHLNHLINEQMTKTKATDEELKEMEEDGQRYEARLNNQKKGGNLSYLRKGQSS